MPSFHILLYMYMLAREAFSDSLRCYSFSAFFASDYNYDDPGDIQRKLERLNQIMNQPDWNPNDPNKKMYLSQCKCTYDSTIRFYSPILKAYRTLHSPCLTINIQARFQF